MSNFYREKLADEIAYIKGTVLADLLLVSIVQLEFLGVFAFGILTCLAFVEPVGEGPLKVRMAPKAAVESVIAEHFRLNGR